MTGFYLQNKDGVTSCARNPVDVSDCLEYADAATCLRCEANFKPQGRLCRAALGSPESAPAENGCLEFSPDSDASLGSARPCVRCDKTFLLMADATCRDLTPTCQHCRQLGPDGCESCDKDYKLDNGFCVALSSLPDTPSALLDCQIINANGLNCVQCDVN